MIDLRSVGRFTIDRWLRVARTPFDRAARFLPEARAPWNSVALLIDRADASVRGAAADLLHDDALREDATRRRAALSERVHALELRALAAEKKAAADDVLAADLERSTERRRQSTIAAREQRDRVAQAASEQQEHVETVAEAREIATEREHEARLATQDKKTKRQRLEILEEEAGALDQEDHALVATDEAQRLRNAASSAKAARKGTA